MIVLRCTYDDGNFTITSFNGTFEEAQEYYLDKIFNVGGGPNDELHVCVKIEVLQPCLEN
ncbi:hypothetical protein HNP86_001795 [Methanococcus maripaludis]|uniref:Uncharacterized protein n=1 Tax=Methanococcus maripaludis TaxID=39152 RepID=A0A7J9P0R9_METMI|nr:hypothetical protein [Methanococcus maripaludis]MBA2851636.1 hypothetical protein [Methanococcus maripaludis]